MLHYLILSRSFRNVTLVLLFLIPIGFALYNLHLRFILVWTLFCILTGLLIRKALRKPLDPSVPRIIYMWFYRIYQVCSNTALVGYLMVMLDLFIPGELLGHALSSIGLLLVFYGVYFGVLGRDLSELCTDKMAQTIGFTGRRDELPSRAINTKLCGICGGSLTPIRADPEKVEPTYEISCGHVSDIGSDFKYHEACIRGWIIVGKKDTCPYCSEKVTWKTSLLKNPWETQTQVWGQILDAVRYLLVWNPIIIITINFVVTLIDSPTANLGAGNSTILNSTAS